MAAVSAPVTSSERLDELLAQLPSEWANVPADQNGEGLALAFIRAAYAAGYVDALTEAAG